jgi:serine/threonine protein kinase
MSDNELKDRAQGRIGVVLCGKYHIDSVLGVGGMAVVFAATHRNQKRVAIKMLHSELSINEQLKTRFLREGYAANTVDHPGAVAVLDDDTAEDGAAFLVMERLEGEEVDRLWEHWGRHLPPEIVLALAWQLLDVLAAAHAKSIIHRDIKPSNLYITRDGTLKVLDFGIARVRDAANAGPSATSTGMMLGTPAYMAPEQALGKSKEMDGTTDVWSVGATLFALLSGEFVHVGESVTELVILVATQPARSLATIAPHIDPRIVAIVDRALAFNKADRWPSAVAMREAVIAAYEAIYGTKLRKDPLERILTEAPSVAGSTAHMPFIAPPTPAPVFSPTPARPSQVPIAPTREMTAWVNPSATPQGRPTTPSPTRDMTAFQGGRPSQVSAPPAPWQSGPGAVAQRSWPNPNLTAEPVSSEPYSPPGVAKKRFSVVLLSVLAALGIAVGGSLVMMLAGSHSSGPIAPATQPALGPSTITASPPPPASTPAVPVVNVSPPPVLPPPPPSPPPRAVPAVPAQTTPVRPTKVDCTIPYVIRNGIRVPKAECE